MLNLFKNNQAFASVLEVIVSSVVFVVASFGIFTTISTLSPTNRESVKKLEAVYVGRQVIDELRGYVDARVWEDSGSLLATGTNHTETIGDYNVTWWLEDVAGLNVRKLQMIVEYPD